MASRPESTSSYPDPSISHNAAGVGPFFNQPSSQHLAHPQAELAQGHPDLQQLRDAPSNHHQLSPPYQPAQSAYDASPQTLGEGLREATAHQSLAQGVLNMGEQQSPSAYDDLSLEPSRKRSKVSRACDECRRKKIRCDAGAEPSVEPCANCRKAGAICRFSRQPLKRGPSKGYIKELSDRLNALESQHAQQRMQYPDYNQSPGSIGPSDDYEHRYNDHHPFTPPSGGHGQHESRKRTHSVSEQHNMYARDDARAAANATRHIHPPSSDTPQQSSDYTATGGSLQPPDASSSARLREALSGTARRSSVGVPYEDDAVEGGTSSLQEWNEEVIDEYFRIVHQTFPLLPHSKTRLKQRLSSCSDTLREAFFLALEAAIRTYPATHLAVLADPAKSMQKAAELIATSQFDNATTRSLAHSLIYIQTLILMALQSDNYGPATMRGHAGPPRGEWIGRAIGMATHLKLNTVRSRDRIGEGDPDADEKLGRRIWWILFILDRWHSTSTSSLLQVPENAAALEPEDQILFGDSMYHLARLSCILGHLSAILQSPASLMAPDSNAAPIITITLLGEIDRFRESVESLLLGAPTLVHLSYWHVRLLVLRLTSSTAPHELLAPATRMASILNSSSTVITPLNHHFAALAALTLVELCEFEETKRGALAGIDDIAAALGGRKGLLSREDSTGWDSAIRDLIVRNKTQASERAQGGLQHLADAAIGGKRAGTGTTSPTAGGEGGGGGGTATWDPTSLTRQGYLAALVHEAAPAA